MRVLGPIGETLAYVAMVALVGVMFLVDVLVFLRYGFFAWLFLVPVVFTLLWLGFALAAGLVWASGVGLVRLARVVAGPRGRTY